MYKQILERLLRGILVVIILVLSYFTLKLSINYIFPFIVAFFLAAILNPFVTSIEAKWRIPRSLATLIVISTIFLICTGLLILIITEVIQGTTYLLERMPIYFTSLLEFVESILEDHIFPFYQSITSYFQSLDPSHQATIQENIEKFVTNLADNGTNFLQSSLLQIPEIVGFIPGLLTIFIVVWLATFMIINDWNNLTKKLINLLPKKIHYFFIDFQQGVKKAFSGYLKAQLILILITAILILLGLMLLKVQHALTIALFAALVDLLPLVGTGIIFIPWILFTFITGNYSFSIAISVLYMIVIITRQVIEPKILATSIGINPLLSLIILFITIQVWGIIGVIAAPFILIIAYVLFQSGIFLKLFHFIKG
ncbi:sporulation integral membrane protein YtvI [Ornithinibacillus bavariensis]|uniref:Sporulation integral membrane protein YtvI n=1 Tax=Ornithinibacillus bavariensis TaxID=545502 RepID=A0A920C8N5_9BACI|nr:sporulation integral membrane protein YtvI [Ornithinibacillus bavariensis]GIO27807.1 sporulation integral membrane protein YtvI [Ornithinibacillus bavariensis]